MLPCKILYQRQILPTTFPCIKMTHPTRAAETKCSLMSLQRMQKQRRTSNYLRSLTLANDIASHPIILGSAAIISDCSSAKQSNIRVYSKLEHSPILPLFFFFFPLHKEQCEPKENKLNETHYTPLRPMYSEI